MNTLKRLLKPTGHILTTAVFTSASIDTLLNTPGRANGAPEPPSTDHQNKSSSPGRQGPVHPVSYPEASSHEGSATARPAARSQESLSVQVSPHSEQRPEYALTFEDIPSTHDSVPILPPPDGPDLEEGPAAPDAVDPQPLQFPTSSELMPPETDAAGSTPNFLDNPVNNPVDTSSAKPAEPGSSEAINASRQRLEERLATIVEQDREERENQFRENLRAIAIRHIRAGRLDAAQRLANNAVFSNQDREQLLSMISSPEPPPAATATPGPIQARPTPLAWQTVSRGHWTLQPAQGVNLAQLCQEAPLGDRPFINPGIGQQPPSTITRADQFPTGSQFLSRIGQQPPSILLASESMSSFNQTINGTKSNTASNPSSANPSSRCEEAVLMAATGPVSVRNYQWMPQFNEPGQADLIFPLAAPAPITSNFGWRVHPISGTRRFHSGVDFGAPMGTPILAAASGRVKTSGWMDGYGLTVELEHDKLNQRTLYAHLSSLAVSSGAWVEQGTVIGWVGSTGNSTGPHLHFEVHQPGANGWVAVDPMRVSSFVNIGSR